VQHTDIIEIANAKSALDQITALNNKFLMHAKANAIPNSIPSSLQISGNDVSIDCLGHMATAKPRTVCTANKNYYMEYVFTVPFGDRLIEVTRFYLSENGQILDAPTDQVSVCDFNNTHIARHLCVRALLGFLASPLLAPAKRSNSQA
jgi:hypothetical protein